MRSDSKGRGFNCSGIRGLGEAMTEQGQVGATEPRSWLGSILISQLWRLISKGSQGLQQKGGQRGCYHAGSLGIWEVENLIRTDSCSIEQEVGTLSLKPFVWQRDSFTHQKQSVQLSCILYCPKAPGIVTWKLTDKSMQRPGPSVSLWGSLPRNS